MVFKSIKKTLVLQNTLIYINYLQISLIKEISIVKRSRNYAKIRKNMRKNSQKHAKKWGWNKECKMGGGLK